MTEKHEDLWGTQFSARDLITPRSILMQQAEVLNTHTSGVLFASVESGELDGSMGHVLKIQAPRLPNSLTSIVTVSHEAQLFPATVRSSALSEVVVCHSLETYTATIREVLSSAATRNCVSALITHSNEQDRIQRTKQATYVIGPEENGSTKRPTLVSAATS